MACVDIEESKSRIFRRSGDIQAMYQFLSRIIGGLLIACGVVLGALGVGAFLSLGAEGLVGTLAAMALGSVFGFVGVRYLRTRAEGVPGETKHAGAAMLVHDPIWRPRLLGMAFVGLALSVIQLSSDLLHGDWLPSIARPALLIGAAGLSLASHRIAVDPQGGLRRGWRRAAHGCVWVLIFVLLSSAAVKVFSDYETDSGPMRDFLMSGPQGALCLALAYGAEIILLFPYRAGVARQNKQATDGWLPRVK